jgi:DNA mismatch endonuclease, patch repair protein
MLVGGQRVRPDVVFTRSRVAVFVDGCFWHGCPEHGETPVANREFWEAKIAGTRERDHRQTAALEDAGWTVVRLWEHEPLDEALARIVAAVKTDVVVQGRSDLARGSEPDGDRKDRRLALVS